jgi:aminotransferase
MPKLSAIKQIEIIARSTPGVISLAQGVPSIPSHLDIRKAACRAINEGKADRYSIGIGIPELRIALSKHLRDNQMNYDPETEIMITAGAIESLSTIFLSLLSPKDEVILLTPTYFANYKRIVEMAGGVSIAVPLLENSKWHIDFIKLEKHITSNTKALILCNPNNPTSSVFTKKEILRLTTLSKKYNFMIIMDDVYSEIVYEKEVYNPLVDPRLKQSIIRIVSFSKSYSLSGWRIAYIHGPKKIMEKLLPFHDNLINCAPVVSQYAALAGITTHKKIISENISVYRKNRTIIMKELDTLSQHFSYSIPEGGYYIFPKLKHIKDDVTFCFDLLKKAKVAIVPGSDFGPGGEGHIRICFGKSEEEIKEGIKRLRKYLA